MKATELQREIIDYPANKKLVVKAGPGTGKTFSLIERIKYLVIEEQLEPETEILVLTFSVAASQEITNRVNSTVEEYNDADLLHITIRTFDSFASSLMYSVDDSMNLDNYDYDERIKLAIEIIEKNEKAQRILNRYKHILVDEVQDLVGPRALLTTAIISAGGGGFTLFGDPTQAVYNFMMDGDCGPDSDQFLERVYKLNKGEVVDFELSENFRVGENVFLKNLAGDGRKVLSEESSRVAYTFLRRKYADLEGLGRLNNPLIPEQLDNTRTAFLCRTNGEALVLASYFAKNNNLFQIIKPLQVSYIPAWIGRTLFLWSSNYIKRDKIEKRVAEIGEHYLESETVWREICNLGIFGNRISVLELRNILKEKGSLVNIVLEDSVKMRVVSTIHRSKGREYDNVVLAISEETDSSKFLDEARIMFVGLTRAKNNLYKISTVGSRGLKKIDNRWCRLMYRNGMQYLNGIEVGCDEDIDRHSFVSQQLYEKDIEEIKENQDYLWQSVSSGCEARLNLYSNSNQVPIYKIWVKSNGDEFVVGLTSISFGKTIMRIIKEVKGASSRTIPYRIEELWVDEVVTEIGDLGNKDIPRAMRYSGLWLGVRLQGIGLCRDWRV